LGGTVLAAVSPAYRCLSFARRFDNFLHAVSRRDPVAPPEMADRMKE